MKYVWGEWKEKQMAKKKKRKKVCPRTALYEQLRAADVPCVYKTSSLYIIIVIFIIMITRYYTAGKETRVYNTLCVSRNCI